MSRPVTVIPAYESAFHAPVLAHEVVEFLHDARQVLDCTLGGGGHAHALLELGASVIGIDRDPDAIAAAESRLREFARGGRFRAVLANYADVDGLAALHDQRFDGVLLDLGVSSHQLDDAQRGFSFRPGAPLDMRMGVGATRDAREFLATADEGELAFIFREYADERRALRLAREVVRRRENRPFETSDDLVGA